MVSTFPFLWTGTRYEDASGVRISAIKNANKGNASGFWFGGLYNYNDNDFKGAMLSGLFNVIEGEIQGVQIAPFLNWAPSNGKFTLQIGALNYLPKYDEKGLLIQIGLYNKCGERTSPLFNIRRSARGTKKSKLERKV